MKKFSFLNAAIVLFSLVTITVAQSTPFLSEKEINMLRNEISGDRSFEHIRVLTQWHRNSGMEGYFKAMDYVAQAAKRNGLTDVKIIKQPYNDRNGNPRNYTAKSAELWITSPFELKLADIGDHALYLSDNSRDADVEADLVWIGTATDAEIRAANVAGKIVLANANPGIAVARAVYQHGAIGVIAYTTSESKNMLDFPDQLPWTRIPAPPQGKKGSFAFSISPRRGQTLRKALQTNREHDLFAVGKRTKGGKITVKAKVDVDIGAENKRTGTGMVEGWIKGTKYKDQQIVITAHLQEEQGSANDDGSGSGNILELARVFNKLIKEGKIPPPKRDLRFWWTDEIYSEYRYLRDNQGEETKMLANLHQDMTGAKQSMGGRRQQLIFNPHSRTSYLDALFESVGRFVIQTNNSYIQSGRSGGYPRPFSQPIIATRGTREPYNAEFVPYFGSSDNLVFVEGKFGVPAAAMVNWDDYYIHSSDDDLDNLDQTQLQRNNFIIGAMALYLAYAEAEDIPLLAAETYAQGGQRMANDLKMALRMLREKRLADASLLIEQGALREKRALNSMRVIAGSNAEANRVIDSYLQLVDKREKSLYEELAVVQVEIQNYSAVSILGPKEAAAAKKIPYNVESSEEYFSKRTRIRTNLHSIMRSEVFNFVDGKRSFYDIYKAVRAESLSEGKFFYGTVTLDDVVRLLDANVKSGALKLR
ncbi:MAG: M28 family peptidase [Pyrinomonadaceae bacterium]|nr:M28 family peptidase [Pyrinomonadaceae bacterium]